jgi:hypothetical protein
LVVWNEMADKNETVKVVVRIRPLSTEEERNGHLATTEADETKGQIVVKNPKSSDR